MLQLLMAVLVICMFFPLMLRMTQSLISIQRFPSEVQDQIGLAQLRRFLNCCKVQSISIDELICVNDKQWHLRCSEKNLFLSPGTIIVLEGIEEVFFDQRDNQIWMLYLRNNQWKEALITNG
ncbi:MAG: hypothetical protein IJ356_05495 [Erysipelotrichaceae bacterium]|nr:hypothetical protein [Erysipelotrichaceae bacterium]